MAWTYTLSVVPMFECLNCSETALIQRVLT